MNGLPPKRERKHFQNNIDIDGKRGHWLWSGNMSDGQTPSMKIKNQKGDYTTTTALRWAIRHKSDQTLPDGPVYRECDEPRCVAPKHAHLPDREPLGLKRRIRIWKSENPDIIDKPDEIIPIEAGNAHEWETTPDPFFSEQSFGIDVDVRSRPTILYIYTSQSLCHPRCSTNTWDLEWSVHIPRVFYDKPFQCTLKGRIMFFVGEIP